MVAAGWIIAFGLPALGRLTSALHHRDETIEPADTVAIAGLVGIVVLLAAVGVLAVVLIRLMRPVREAAEFADRLAAGEMPSVLPVGGNGSDEIGRLITSLNFLRDHVISFKLE